jgi:hypothetical protein
MKMKFSLVAVGALLLAAVPILAHHSFSAEYERKVHQAGLGEPPLLGSF